MSGQPTVNFSDSDEGLFAPAEIHRLMRIEYERAQRYDYPAAVMLIAVDRLEYLHDLYGWQSKEEILQAVIGVLRRTTRDSDFLGCMRDDRIMAVFPHASQEAVAAIATRLMRVCRQIDFETAGRAIRATVSIGIATLRQGDRTPFEEFVSVAGEAVAFAMRSGGDRFVRRESAVDVIDELRQDLEAEAQKLAEDRAPAPMPAPTAPLTPEIEDLPETDLGTRLRAAFRLHGRVPGSLPLENDVVEIAEDALREAEARAGSGKSADVDVLERRIAKLRELLDQTERALEEMADAKGVGSGIASIYRTVQGLKAGEKGAEQKKEMLSLIFEANLDLQKGRKDKGS